MVAVDSIIASDIMLDFALIDVEKMEVKALIGMKDVISRSPTLIIVCEWQYKLNPNSSEEEAMHFLAFMKELGYKIFHYTGPLDRVSEDCSVGSFMEYTKIETLLNIHMTDIYFFPKGIDPPS